MRALALPTHRRRFDHGLALFVAPDDPGTPGGRSPRIGVDLRGRPRTEDQADPCITAAAAVALEAKAPAVSIRLCRMRAVRAKSGMAVPGANASTAAAGRVEPSVNVEYHRTRPAGVPLAVQLLYTGFAANVPKRAYRRPSMMGLPGFEPGRDGL